MNSHAAKLLMSMPFAVLTEEGGQLLGVTQFAEDAAALVSVVGTDGIVIHNSETGINPSLVLWIEGVDGWAGESYDEAAALMNKRLQDSGKGILV